ncbi:hypothetical protein FAIPA1_240007 [Frankia sp. AiPs1]
MRSYVETVSTGVLPASGVLDAAICCRCGHRAGAGRRRAGIRWPPGAEPSLVRSGNGGLEREGMVAEAPETPNLCPAGVRGGRIGSFAGG